MKEKHFEISECEQTPGQVFDKDITFKLGGKEQKIYEYTQAAREDTEIYPVLEKYGCIDKIKRDVADIYGDAKVMKDLRGTFEDMKKADEIWNGIPLEIRQKFDNNRDKFIKDGMKWAETEVKKREETAKKAKEILEAQAAKQQQSKGNLTNE